MTDLWLFVEWGPNQTWTRAQVPAGIVTSRDMLGYLQRGGRVQSHWMDLPERARFTPRVVGQMTVIATLVPVSQER